MPIGVPELVIILVIVLLVFGPKRLPGLGKQLGTGMREFKDGITGKDKGDAEEGNDAAVRAFGDEPPARDEPAAIAAAPEPPAAAPSTPEEPATVTGEPPAETPRTEG
jgi:sec-independent protein translocase protein TatA